MMKINKKIKLAILVLGALVFSGAVVVQNNFFGKIEKKNIIVNKDWIVVDKNQLLGMSDAVVIGTAISNKSFTRPSVVLSGEDDVYTNIVFGVDSYLYNPKNFSVNKITLTVLGGEASNVVMKIENEVPFKVGHKYVVFIKQQNNDLVFVPVAGPQGTYELDVSGEIVINDFQKGMIKNVFGQSLVTLEQLKAEIATAKLEPISGMKN